MAALSAASPSLKARRFPGPRIRSGAAITRRPNRRSQPAAQHRAGPLARGASLEYPDSGRRLGAISQLLGVAGVPRCQDRFENGGNRGHLAGDFQPRPPRLDSRARRPRRSRGGQRSTGPHRSFWPSPANGHTSRSTSEAPSPRPSGKSTDSLCGRTPLESSSPGAPAFVTPSDLRRSGARFSLSQSSDMPGFPVLTTIQPIVGSDFHKSIPPPPPAGPLMVPHVVVWGSGLSQKTGFMWAIASTSRASSPESGCPNRRSWVSVTAAVGLTTPGRIPVTSGRTCCFRSFCSVRKQSQFGSGTVKVAVSPQGGGTADMAINVAYVLNLNLDCQDFPLPPMPTGLSFTIHYSVTAGFSFHDFLRGRFSWPWIWQLPGSWASGARWPVPSWRV